MPLEEGETVPKKEERQLVNTAVSENATSVEQCPPLHQVPSVLPKSKPACLLQAVPHTHCGMDPKISTLSVPHGNISKSFCSPEVIPLTQHGIKPTLPANREGIHMETTPLETVIDATWGAAGRVNGCGDSSNVL